MTDVGLSQILAAEEAQFVRESPAGEGKMRIARRAGTVVGVDRRPYEWAAT